MQDATPADLYLDAAGLQAEGVTAEAIASWISSYTVGENLPDGAPGRDLVPSERLNDTLFAAAFTAEFLAAPGLDLTSLGIGDYREDSDLPVIYNLGG